MLYESIRRMRRRKADDLRIMQQLSHGQPELLCAFINALLKADGQVMRGSIYFDPFCPSATGEETISEGSAVVYIYCESHRGHPANLITPYSLSAFGCQIGKKYSGMIASARH